MLIFVGIVLPVVMMMVLWHYLAGTPDSALQSPSRPAPSSNAGRVEPAGRNALKDIPLHEKSRGTLAGADASLGRRAAGWLDSVEEAARDSADVQRRTAALLLRQGKYAAAAEAYDRLLTRASDDPTLLTGKAMALAGLNRYDDALALIENAVRIDARNPTAHFNHAVILMRADKQDDAAQALHRVLELKPGHVKAMFNLALLHQAAGRRQESLAIWRKLTEPKPSDIGKPEGRMLTDAWSHRGELALELGEAGEAEASFLEVVRLEPRSAEGWCNVGIARAHQVRRSDAMTALQISLQLDARLVPALNQAAYIQAALYRDTGELEYGRKVVEYCRRSLAVNPDQQNMAALLNAAREFDLAQRRQQEIDALAR